jgi:hypothetical protein
MGMSRSVVGCWIGAGAFAVGAGRGGVRQTLHTPRATERARPGGVRQAIIENVDLPVDVDFVYVTVMNENKVLRIAK